MNEVMYPTIYVAHLDLWGFEKEYVVERPLHELKFPVPPWDRAWHTPHEQDGPDTTSMRTLVFRLVNVIPDWKANAKTLMYEFDRMEGM